MIEPKGIALHLHRRIESRGDESLGASSNVVEHEEPEQPVHPEFEYETLAEEECEDALANEHDGHVTSASSSKWKRKLKLAASFVALIVSGTGMRKMTLSLNRLTQSSGHVVLLKVQTLPMYNYPIFLSIFTHLMFVPVCFAYILPVQKYGLFSSAISEDHNLIPRFPFIVMGFLDCLAMSLQIFSSVYLPGSLLVLLPQFAIPVSMVLSRFLLHSRYNWQQYVGAAVVMIGLCLVLAPVLLRRRGPRFLCQAFEEEEHCKACREARTADVCLSLRHNDFWLDDDVWGVSDHIPTRNSLCEWLPFEETRQHEEFLHVMWSFALLASTIPMTLSAIYKQMALKERTQLDPVYLCGWTSLFQLLFSLLLIIPTGYFVSPKVAPSEIPENVWSGALCVLGYDSVEAGCHPDQCTPAAALYVCLCIVFHVLYTATMMFVLKYGSCNVLFLAQTLLVPLANLVFYIHSSSVAHVSDVLGLLVIVSGLVLYRFLDGSPEVEDTASNSGLDWVDEMIQQMRQPLIQHGDV